MPALKDRLLTKADIVSSPFPVMDLMGRDAYTASLLTRNITDPGHSIPALAVIFSGVATAIGVDIQTGIALVQDGALALCAHFGSQKIAPTAWKKDKTFYLDRRQPQTQELGPETAYWLGRWHALNKEALTQTIILLPVGFGIPAIAGGSGKWLTAWFMALAFKASADTWRTHRALTKAWMTLDSLPPKKEKEDVPAGLPQVHFQPIPVPARP